MTDFAKHLAAEIVRLEKVIEADPNVIRLRELRRVHMLYLHGHQAMANGHAHQGTSFRVPIIQHTVAPKATREMSPETKRIIDEARAYLSDKTAPVRLRTLYNFLVDERGCQIGGKDPVNGLSAILARSPDFISHRRSGWTSAQLKLPQACRGVPYETEDEVELTPRREVSPHHEIGA